LTKYCPEKKHYLGRNSIRGRPKTKGLYEKPVRREKASLDTTRCDACVPRASESIFGG